MSHDATDTQDRADVPPIVTETPVETTTPVEDTAAEAATETAPEAPGEPIDVETVKAGIIEAMKTVYDPEIPVNIYELGLIYEINLSEFGDSVVKMTLTSPSCPAAGTLPGEVETKVGKVEGVRSSKIDLVWEPTWDKDMMSEAAKLALGID